MKRWLLLVGVLMSSSVYAFEKPTWCGKAEKTSDKMVCEDEELSASAIALDKKWDTFRATQSQDAIDKARTFLRMWNKEIVQKCTNKSCIAAAHEVAINNELLVMNGKSANTASKAEDMADTASTKEASCIEAKGEMATPPSSDEQVRLLQELMGKSPDCERYGITWSYQQGILKNAAFLLYDLSEKPESIYRIKISDLTGKVGKPEPDYIKMSPSPRDETKKDDPEDGFDAPIAKDEIGELPDLPKGTADFLQKELVKTVE